MSTQKEGTAEDLFEEFLNGTVSTVDVTNLLGRCREDERTHLGNALVAIDSVYKYHEAPLVATPNGVSRLRARLNAAKRREEIADESRRSGLPVLEVQLADAKRRLDLDRERLRFQPVASIADALNIVGLNLGGTDHQDRVGVMRRSSTEVKARLSRDDVWFQAQYERLLDEASKVLEIAKYHTPPVNLAEVAKSLGILAIEVDLSESPEREAEGLTVTDGKVGGIIINSVVTFGPRKRFTFGHEIGHFVLHKSSGVFRDSAKELSDYATVQELEANLFSSALLMPKASLGRYVVPSMPPSFAQAHTVTEVFQVSTQAALIRIMRESDHPCAFVVSKSGRIHSVVPSRHFEKTILNGGLLHRGTIASELQNWAGQGRATRSGMVKTDLWTGSAGDAEETIKEASFRFSGETVYTILVSQ